MKRARHLRRVAAAVALAAATGIAAGTPAAPAPDQQPNASSSVAYRDVSGTTSTYHLDGDGICSADHPGTDVLDRRTLTLMAAR